MHTQCLTVIQYVNVYRFIYFLNVKYGLRCV
jgi:hypothetical protein